MSEIDLDNLTIIIRKSTPKNHRRAKIFVKKEKAKIEITEKEKWFCLVDMTCVMNHEFLHWVICILTHTNAKQYDEFLEEYGLYSHEILLETML